MAYTTQKSFVRIDTNIPFWTWSTPQIKDYVTRTYVNTGKVKFSETIESDSSVKRTTEFPDKATHDAFVSDPILVPEWEKIAKYNKDNNIILVNGVQFNS